MEGAITLGPTGLDDPRVKLVVSPCRRMVAVFVASVDSVNGTFDLFPH